jgi:5-hydroxyisourate hydrolase
VTVTSHVLDASTGEPAAGVPVRLDRLDTDGAGGRGGRGARGGWSTLAEGSTDGDGRLRDWVPDGAVRPGVHRLAFGTGRWFAARRQATFYPEVVVVFEVVDSAEHLHVPLLLSPFAYSTYRGS